VSSFLNPLLPGLFDKCQVVSFFQNPGALLLETCAGSTFPLTGSCFQNENEKQARWPFEQDLSF